MSERILIIQMAKLGDFIQTTPLLANLRRHYDHAELVVAAEQPATLEAARLSPLVDSMVKIDDGVNSFDHLGDFSDIFILNSHIRAVKLSATARAQNRYGPQLVRERISFTTAQNFLMALMSLRRDLGRFNLVDVWTSLSPGAIPHQLVWPLTTPSRLLPQDTSMKIGLQLGSRNHLRRWPVENFVQMAAGLTKLHPDRSITLVLLGSAEERALGTKFEKLSAGAGLSAPVNLLGRTSLEELGRVASGLDLLITADTGVMHLAAAVETPVLALFFGPAYGPETGPYGSGHIIYQAAAPCAPCREGGCRRRQCLEMPAPEVAAHLAARMIKPRGVARMASGLKDLPISTGHQVWQTTSDGFGQSLRPLGRPTLTADEALTLLITMAGRSVIRPHYQSADRDMGEMLSEYKMPDDPFTVDRHFMSELANKGFSDNPRYREAFLATVGNLALTFGLKLA